MVYGASVEGRDLQALRIPARITNAPRVLCSANIHGPEFVGTALALALAEVVAEGTGIFAALRSQAELWVIPSLNPDGYARTWECNGIGTLAELRTNARGVDLNRNFPLPRGRRFPFPGAGSQRPGKATYVGPAALSEPETDALHRFLEPLGFRASANLHSFMGTLIPAHVKSRAEYVQYKRLCRAFVAAQRSHRYRRLSSRWLDGFTGELEDHQHHALGTWAVCVEVFPFVASFAQHRRAPSLFWRFNPRDPVPWIHNDIEGIANFFAAALELDAPSAFSS